VSRIRTVKPELFESPSLAKVSRESRYVFIGLFTLADDHGRLRYLPKRVAGDLFPLDDDVTEVEVKKWVTELEEIECVRVYEFEEKTYLYLPEWEKHQKIDHPSASRIPEPLANVSRRSREGFAPGSRKSEVGSRKSDIGSLAHEPEAETPKSEPEPNIAPKVATKRSRRKPQTEFTEDFVLTEDMRNWPTALTVLEAGGSLEAEFEKFKNYHIAKGSMFADWRAAFRTWLSNSVEFSRGRAKPPGTEVNRFTALLLKEAGEANIIEGHATEGREIG
jgi:hypothetical protein